MSGRAQKPTDRGLGAVRDLHAKLQIEPEWCLSDERGFTWWAKDLAQHIWADPEAKNVNGETFHRLHACTDVFEGFDGSDRQIAVLNALNQNASLSAFLADDDRPGRVQLRCSMLFYPDNAEYVGLVFSTAVALQVAEAFITASWFPGEMRGGAVSMLVIPRW